MSEEDLLNAIQGFLTDVQHGNSSCRLEIKSVDGPLPGVVGTVLSVTTDDDEMFYVAVTAQ